MKDIIFYHRAYRRIAAANKKLLLELMLLMLPLLLSIVLLYPKITLLMNSAAKHILMSSFPSDSIEIVRRTYLFKSVYTLYMEGRYPTPLLSLIIFLFSLSGIFIMLRIRVPRPVAAWIIFISSINLVSSIFFIFSPSIFPYTIEDFSELYIKTEVSIWFFVPVLMGSALLFIPSNILVRFSIVALTILYSVIFGALRYTVFLYILKKFSYIFMPLLFFAFGPLMDFTYMVGLYSLYCSIVARNRNNRAEIGLWRWS